MSTCLLVNLSATFSCFLRRVGNWGYIYVAAISLFISIGRSISWGSSEHPLRWFFFVFVYFMFKGFSLSNKNINNNLVSVCCASCRVCLCRAIVSKLLCHPISIRRPMAKLRKNIKEPYVWINVMVYLLTRLLVNLLKSFFLFFLIGDGNMYYV